MKITLIEGVGSQGGCNRSGRDKPRLSVPMAMSHYHHGDRLFRSPICHLRCPVKWLKLFMKNVCLLGVFKDPLDALGRAGIFWESGNKTHLQPERVCAHACMPAYMCV